MITFFRGVEVDVLFGSNLRNFSSLGPSSTLPSIFVRKGSSAKVKPPKTKVGFNNRYPRTSRYSGYKSQYCRYLSAVNTAKKIRI